MNVIVKEIQITPPKRGKDGAITEPATALITIEAPLDDQAQRQEFAYLMPFLHEEWLTVSLAARRLNVEVLGDKETVLRLKESEDVDDCKG